MVDINEWQLKVPSMPALNFGTLASDYPLIAQFDIGDASAVTQDGPHPNSDGEVFGIDRLTGFPIIFNIRALDDGLQANKWDKPLDLVSAFQAVWRADNLRGNPGAYATLANLSRNKIVYGRPRQMAPRHARLRKGIGDFVCTFKTNSPNWYSLTEKNVTLSLVAGASFGFNSPLTAPITTVGEQVDDFVIDNDGNLETWPVIQMFGPGTGWSLELRSGGESLWKVEVEERIQYDEVLTIDTRPWARGAKVGLATDLLGSTHRPANGLLRGDSISLLTIPVGNFQFRLRVKDGTGTAEAKVFWRDAYASL